MRVVRLRRVVLDDWVVEELAELAASGLLRASEGVFEGLLDAASNDYLGFARRSVSRATLFGRSAGAGASRLIFGTTEPHLQLENQLSEWVGAPAALLFSSGYAANIGVLTALGSSDTLIVSDELNHASIIDGCRLSRALVTRTPHLDLEAIEAVLKRRQARRALVVVESYYSMDGDTPDLAALRNLCDRHDAALIVDEAHALGVFGPEGAGICARDQVPADVLVGTLGKAVGVQGAFVATSENVRRLIWNRARSFVFSTAPSPVITALTVDRVKEVRSAEEDRGRLHALTTELRQALEMPAGNHGPILPVRLPEGAAARAEQHFANHGIRVRAVRPPTVPKGTDRLRLTAHSDWPDDGPSRLLAALQSI
ncbi:MAG: 8-amino-7-oxononanoate synthase [Polyangiaceae bacterium]